MGCKLTSPSGWHGGEGQWQPLLSSPQHLHLGLWVKPSCPCLSNGRAEAWVIYNSQATNKFGVRLQNIKNKLLSGSGLGVGTWSPAIDTLEEELDLCFSVRQSANTWLSEARSREYNDNKAGYETIQKRGGGDPHL